MGREPKFNSNYNRQLGITAKEQRELDGKLLRGERLQRWGDLPNQLDRTLAEGRSRTQTSKLGNEELDPSTDEG